MQLMEDWPVRSYRLSRVHQISPLGASCMYGVHISTSCFILLTQIHVLDLYLILYLAASQVCIASSWVMEQELYLEALICHWKLGRTWLTLHTFRPWDACLFCCSCWMGAWVQSLDLYAGQWTGLRMWPPNAIGLLQKKILHIWESKNMFRTMPYNRGQRLARQPCTAVLRLLSSSDSCAGGRYCAFYDPWMSFGQ